MRGSFIKRFISDLFDHIRESGEELSRISYKGCRYSDFNIYGYPVRKTYTGFKNLENRKLIRRTGEDTFKFTRNGEGWLKKFAFQYFKARYPKWDKKWRLVIFDIPRDLNAKRDALRTRLKYMGFFML